MYKENPDHDVKYAVERIGSIRPDTSLHVEEVRLRYHVEVDESILINEEA